MCSSTDPASTRFRFPINGHQTTIAFFLVCFTGWMGPVANYAHGGGLALGMAWGWISAKIALRNV